MMRTNIKHLRRYHIIVGHFGLWQWHLQAASYSMRSPYVCCWYHSAPTALFSYHRSQVTSLYKGVQLCSVSCVAVYCVLSLGGLTGCMWGLRYQHLAYSETLGQAEGAGRSRS